MRHPWLRALVTLLFVTLYVASSTVAAFGFCCGHDGAASAPVMECCLKGGKGHICPFMTKRAHTPAAGGALEAPCSAGHDDGVPVGGFAAPPLAPATIAPPQETSSVFPATIVVLHNLDLLPQSPPPKA